MTALPSDAPPTLELALTARSAVDEQITAVEMPTLLLILGTYGAWLTLTGAYGHWPLAIVAPLVAVLIALHGSVQHEIIHGHPTRSASINRLLAMPSLSLWLPFALYQREHLQHHRDERLTDPLDDPETYYWTAEDWRRIGPVTQRSLRIQQTLAGRVVIGSFWRIGALLHRQLRAVIANQGEARSIWIEHLLWCVPIVAWLKLACGMPVWVYFAAMVIPANGILLIRSFAEHRAKSVVPQRIAIVEGSWILGPLFLFNNLHSLHHEAPMIPWYRYNASYRRNRERLIAQNGGLVYRTYFDVARRFMFRPHDAMLHPTDRVAGNTATDQAG